MTSVRVLLLLLTLVVFSYPAHSIDCDTATLTLAQCQSFLGSRQQAINDKLEQSTETGRGESDNARRGLRVVTTGDVSLKSSGNSVSLNDLLPILNIAVDPATSGDVQTAGITAEYSPERQILSGDFKVGISARTPSISDAVREAITDADTISELDSQFDYTDDVELVLTYSYIGRIGGVQVGRSDLFYENLLAGMLDAADRQARQESVDIRRFFPRLFDDLLRIYPSEVAADVGDALGNRTIDELKNALTDANFIVFSNVSDLQFLASEVAYVSSGSTPLADTYTTCQATLTGLLVAGDGDVQRVAGDFASCVHEGLLNAIEVGVRQHIDRTARYNDFLTNNGLFKIAPLINNQPQLLFSATGRFRDDLAGGDQYGLKLSFEFDMSGHNLNNLGRYLRHQPCAAGVSAGDFTVDTFSNCALAVGEYVNDNPVEQGSWRSAVNVEYLRRPSFTAELPAVMTPFMQDESKSLIASVVVGRQFQLLENSNLPKAKLDFSISYDDVSDDPMRQSRALGNITFTQQLAEATQLSVGLVWANKPEFRGDVDEELGARIGLNYKFGGIGAND